MKHSLIGPTCKLGCRLKTNGNWCRVWWRVAIPLECVGTAATTAKRWRLLMSGCLCRRPNPAFPLHSHPICRTSPVTWTCWGKAATPLASVWFHSGLESIKQCWKAYASPFWIKWVPISILSSTCSWTWYCRCLSSFASPVSSRTPNSARWSISGPSWTHPYSYHFCLCLWLNLWWYSCCSWPWEMWMDRCPPSVSCMATKWTTWRCLWSCPKVGNPLWSASCCWASTSWWAQSKVTSIPTPAKFTQTGYKFSW